MFGLGGGELGVVLLVILLLFGPSQLPKMARAVGEALREFKRAQRELHDEIRGDETKPQDRKPVE